MQVRGANVAIDLGAMRQPYARMRYTISASVTTLGLISNEYTPNRPFPWASESCTT
jgi:hypothetical protein